MTAFDVEYIGQRTRQVRLGDLVITASTERRGSRPKVGGAAPRPIDHVTPPKRPAASSTGGRWR